MAHYALQFQQTSQWQDPAVFDYEAEVLQVWRDFPEIKNKFYFVDASAGGELVYPAEDEGRKTARRILLLENIKGVVEDRAVREGRKNSFCTPLPYGRRVLALYNEKHIYGLLNTTAHVTQETTFAYDHELAHALIPEGMPAKGDPANRPETIADVYAVIRHFQRYGADSTAIDAIVANRAFAFVFAESKYGYDHFTSPVTEKILALRHGIAWQALTPQQTIEMARDFVLDHEMKMEPLHLLHNTFKEFHDTANDILSGNFVSMRALEQIVSNATSPLVSKYGAAALEACATKQQKGLMP